VQAFIPPPLPPNPPLELGALYQHLDRANQALGRLDGLTTLLPDTKFFLYLYIRKETLSLYPERGTFVVPDRGKAKGRKTTTAGIAGASAESAPMTGSA